MIEMKCAYENVLCNFKGIKCKDCPKQNKETIKNETTRLESSSDSNSKKTR